MSTLGDASRPPSGRTTPSIRPGQTSTPPPGDEARPKLRKAFSRGRTPTIQNSQPQAGLEGTELSRVTSSGSYHARHSLHRMATHETGEFVEDEDHGRGALDTHEEHEHEHEHEHDHDHPYQHEHESEREHKHGHGHATPGDANYEKGSTGVSGSKGDVDEEAAIESTGVASLGEKATPGTKPDPGNADGQLKKDKYELQDQTNLLPVKQVILIFVGLSAALFCSLLDQTIVTTALPTLGRVFNQASIVSWVGTAYLLTSTSLQPVYGRLSDIFGRKAVLLGSLVIFLLGSLACAVAQTMIELIIFRAIQGIGGGGILTLSMIIISDVVSLKDRGKFQGFVGVVVAISNSCGPIIGGAFTERVSWRWCFYINLPLTAMAILVVFFFVPLKKVKGSVKSKLLKLDYYGSILTLAWAILVLLALSWGGTQYSWSSAAVLAPLIIGLALLVVFIIVEAKVVPLPLVPMYIFKNGTVAASMFSTFCNGLCFFAMLYYLPQYYQVVRDSTPIEAGVEMLPLTIVQVVCSFASGMIVSKTGDYKWNLTAGFGIWAIGLGLMSTITPTTSKAHLYGYQVLVAIGAGQTFQTSLIAIQASVSRQDMATATGCRNFLRMLGGTVALAACTAIVNNIVGTRLESAGFSPDLVSRVLDRPTELVAMGLSPEEIITVKLAYARGIDAVFWLSAPLAALSFFITVFFVKRVSIKRPDDAKRKEEGKAWLEAQKAKKRGHGEASSRAPSVTPEKSSQSRPHSPERKIEDETSPERSTASDSTLTNHPAKQTLEGSDTSFLTRVRTHTSALTHELTLEVEDASKGMEEASGVLTR